MDSLVLLAIKLNQKLSFFPRYRITWNNLMRQWHYDNNWEKYSFYYLNSLQEVLFLLCSMLVILWNIYVDDVIDLLSFSILILLSMMGSMSVFSDVLLFVYGSDMTNLTNWIYQKCRWKQKPLQKKNLMNFLKPGNQCLFFKKKSFLSNSTLFFLD